MTILESAFPVASCLAGLAAVVLAIRAYRRSRDTDNWMPVPATILRSKVVGTEDGPITEVWYRYTLEGREYECSNVRLSYLTWSFGHRRAAAIKSLYPATAQVTAYVNPRRPSEAVLQQGAQLGVAVFVALMGLLFLAIGIYKLLVGAAYVES